jgi:hypothetical protein
VYPRRPPAAAPGGGSILPERIVGPNTDVIEVAGEILRFVAKYARTDAPPLR